MSMYVESVMLQNQRAIMRALQVILRTGQVNGKREADSLEANITITTECIKDKD